MAIPADNVPARDIQDAKQQQEKRIYDVANNGACVQKEVKFNKPAPKEKCIFGDV